MGYRESKKQNNKPSLTFSENLLLGWKDRYPVLLFACGFMFLIFIFYMFWLSSFFNLKINPLITEFNARLSSSALKLLGQQTNSSGNIIFSPLFSISVAKGCDGIEAMAVFTSALLSFPVSWRKKIRGVMIGILALFTLNLIRIISLFIIGLHYPAFFETMHAELWPLFFVLFAVGLWASVIHKANRKMNTN